MLSTESFYCIGALFISTISCMRNFLCFMFYPKLVLVKTYAFGKMKKICFSFFFFFFSEQVTLLFVGDISFSGPVKYYVEHNYHSYNDSFRDVAPFIREADISIANLESPFVSNDLYCCQDKEKKVLLDSSPEAVLALR